jgi:hypothetical protein
MPVYSDQVSIAAAATFTVPLSPNDRFGGRGGRVRVRSVATSGATSGLVRRTIFVGNELVEPDSGVLLKATGVDNFTPAQENIGAPADPVKVSFKNTSAGVIVVDYFVEIENF